MKTDNIFSNLTEALKQNAYQCVQAFDDEKQTIDTVKLIQNTMQLLVFALASFIVQNKEDVDIILHKLFKDLTKGTTEYIKRLTKLEN
jgi:hypothetical protein